MTSLPVPPADVAGAIAWTASHLGDLTVEGADGVRASPVFRGGQSRADAALAAFDVAGYAARRNEVHPSRARGASRLSPYIRHGLLDLPRVWAHVAGGPSRDVEKFRDELLWQEYARHVYARTAGMARSLRYEVRERGPGHPTAEDVWDRDMACLDLVVDELTTDGWLVNQTRMWLASHWSVRHGWGWRDGEDVFFTHLLDGSRAANRLGWQWTVGAGTGKAYGFSRNQVEKRAPGVCRGCPLRSTCPIESWPSQATPPAAQDIAGVRRDIDPEATAGPEQVWSVQTPEAVWLTGESLGDDDPALSAHPDLPAVFVFDEPLLARLRLSSKRLVFLAETLGDLATRRTVEIYRGRPVEVLDGRPLAVTFAPVPGWRRIADLVGPTQVHPWRWLVRPGAGPAGSYSAWRRGHRA